LAIEFRENLARQQRLKKKPGALMSPSWRVTPVHSELIRLGFRDYWQAMAATGVGPLFPALPRGWQNGLAASLGKWFGPYKSAQGFEGVPKSLHSFRHTVRQELGFAGVDSSLSSAIIGHTNPDVHDATYGRDMRRHPDRLRPHLERLQFQGLSLPRLFSASVWRK
jgi:integrase